ncbi:hypothetical protein DRQ25_16735, partial [Candidatus Fermentibacteria bacterium]
MTNEDKQRQMVDSSPEPVDTKQISTNATQVTVPDKEDLLIRNLFLYTSKQEAAIQAGYSQSFAKSGLYAKLRTKRIQDKIRDYAIANDMLDIPIILAMETRA